MKFNTLLWLLTSGLQFVVGWWYRKQAVFYLPQGWFGPLGWWLSLPFAPAGSVSVGVWQMACKRVILVGERVLKDLVGKHYQRLLKLDWPMTDRPSARCIFRADRPDRGSRYHEYSPDAI